MSQGLRDAGFIASDARANFKQIIAKRPDLVRFLGGRLKPNVSYNAGQVLGLAATGGDAGFYKAYASGNTDGSQVAVGVLGENAGSDSTGYGSEAQIIVGGTLFKDKLIGLDSGAITNMNGASGVEHGVNLLTINAAG
jgi:hypothetical protein